MAGSLLLGLCVAVVAVSGWQEVCGSILPGGLCVQPLICNSVFITKLTCSVCAMTNTLLQLDVCSMHGHSTGHLNPQLGPPPGLPKVLDPHPCPPPSPPLASRPKQVVAWYDNEWVSDLLRSCRQAVLK